jgi:hypothetical protein
MASTLTSTALAASPPPSNTAMPKVSAPLPVTSSSYPWNSASQNVVQLNLAASGYQEQEFVVSGLANVYTWSGNTAVIQTANAPYTTRILVRRPIKSSDFSGDVHVEMLNSSYGFDLDFMWPASHWWMMARGDAWIGVTVRPSSIRSLKQFDSQRYASLSMANPVPPTATCASPADNGSPTTENGLAWDIFSQVGVLARNTSGSAPMAGLSVERVYGSGYSLMGTAMQIYVNAISPYASQSNGSPIFDGFLIGAPAGGMMGSINQCAAWVPAGDPRIVIQPNRSPIIRVNTTSDFGYYFGGPAGIGIPAATTLNRRPDDDAPNDRYRGYEIPGATHLWTYLMAYMPGAAEMARIGAAPVHACGETPPNSFPLQYFLDGALDNLNSWARFGTPPPHGDRIAVNNPGTPSESIIFDKYGNPTGGVRSPYLDLPRMTYAWYNDGSGCGSVGHLVPFPQATLNALYGTNRNYRSMLIDASFNLVANRWVPEMDGRNIILDAEQMAP